MNLRLAAAGLLVRGGAVTRWLEMVDRTVSDSLAPLAGGEISHYVPLRIDGGPAGYRIAMAEKHAKLVNLLIERKGRDAGVRDGRLAMHEAGIDLGQRLRADLRLTDREEDLIAAARLLYRILGIEFEVRPDGDGATMTVHRCSLAERYTPLTCEVISAMDEGVVAGLRPGTRMNFTKRNSSGACQCEASIVWRDGT
jgi:hypothetical protein